jgi:hypothetical protein
VDKTTWVTKSAHSPFFRIFNDIFAIILEFSPVSGFCHLYPFVLFLKKPLRELQTGFLVPVFPGQYPGTAEPQLGWGNRILISASCLPPPSSLVWHHDDHGKDAPMSRAPGMIDHRTLLTQVVNTAPFLFEENAEKTQAGAPMAELAKQPRGWLKILRTAANWPKDKHFKPSGEDYFCLCLAAHHATVGTYVPTDVDSKIRATLWRGLQAQTLAKRVEIASHARAWSIDGINARTVTLPGHAVISGHDGEHLAVAMAAWGGLLTAGDTAGAAAMETVIAHEVAREAAAFTAAIAPGADLIDTLRLAAILTHNAGDIDQGLSGWPEKAELSEKRNRFSRLAHRETTDAPSELPETVITAFTQAARLYKAVMAPEGHRNYPLRAVKELRASADFLLPISPFLDSWGHMLARHQTFGIHGCAAVAEALITGCGKVPGQQGYQRALAGLFAGLEVPRHALERRLSPAAKAALQPGTTLARTIAVPEEEFSAEMRERARETLAS